MTLVALILLVHRDAEAQVRPPDTVFALRYRALVDAYRTGDADGAVRDLLALDEQAVESLVLRYGKLAQVQLHSAPLTYTPRNVATGGWHSLDVELKKQRADVKARRGYLRGRPN